MSREFLEEVLDKFAQVTSILVETSKIKDDLERKKSHDTDYKDILKRTQKQVESLYEHATSVRDFFKKQPKDRNKANGKASDSGSDNESNSDANENDTGDAKAKKPLIKLVDIKKLVEPRNLLKKQTSNVTPVLPNNTTIDTVVILSSDEEETTKTTRSRVAKVKTAPATKVKTAPLPPPPPKVVPRRKTAEKTIKKTRMQLRSSSSESESSDDVLSNVSKKNLKKKKTSKKQSLDKITLSDTNSSSSSEDEATHTVKNKKKSEKKESTEDEEVENKKKSKKKESTEDEEVKNKKKSKKKESTEDEEEESITDAPPPDWKKDPKFNCESYVQVLRVPCEKLKEYYLEKLELRQVSRLCDIGSLKRKRRKSLSASSSENDNRRKNTPKRKPTHKEVIEKSDSDNTKSDLELDKDKETDKNAPEANAELVEAIQGQDDAERIAEDALNLLNSDKESDDSVLSSAEKSDHEPEKEKNDDAPEEQEEASKDKEKEDVDKENEAPIEVNKDAQKEDEGEKSNKEDEPEKLSNEDEGEKSSKEDDAEKSSKVDAEKSSKEDDGEKSTKEDDGEKSSKEDDGEKSTKEDDGEKSSKEDDSEKSSKEDDGEKSNKEKSDQDSEKEKEKNKDNSKKKWRKDKLLTTNISSSDSEDEFEKFKRKKENMQKDVLSSDDEPLPSNKKKRLMKKRKKKAVVSDSDSGKNDSSDNSESEKSSSSSESEKEKRKEEEEDKPKRKRVKRVCDSSDEDDADKSTRKQIRNIWGKDSLAETTKQAEAEEKERKARIAEKQKKYNQIYESSSLKNAKVEKVVLDYDEENKKELLKVDDSLVSKLKPHQASGIQFMWDACFESLERAQNTKGSGCILAHCMGLGKTLQVIALSHTLLINSEETKVKKILVVSPLNTVLNWVNEFKQWLPDLDEYEVYELVSFKQNYERQYQVKLWHSNGGVLVIGYDMFRNLSNPENKRLSKKMRHVFQEALVDPGPDLVICDEGHLLKNEKTNLSIAMTRIKTMRRIVLTGTPLQNNLKEYFCMVQFIKPNLLGTYKEYLNRFVNPIINGQYTDSTPHDIQIMRKRSHVLHKMLDGVVQRRDYSVLEPYLPPKHEYVLFLNLTETQIKLYQYYMDHFARRSTDGSNRTSFLFVDFQALQRICTHPRVLLDKSIEMKRAKDKLDDSEEDSEGSLKDFIDDDDEKSTSSSNSSSNEDNEGKEEAPVSRKRITRATAAAAKENGEEDILEVMEVILEKKEWWQEICDGKELDNIAHSSKLFLLFEILKECEQIGDKVLVFSQSLYSLNVIEYFLGKIHDATQEGETLAGYSGSWCLGLDYFRLDGSSSCDSRNIWCKTFNDPANTRARLFLISTRAGGLGINLVAANRVIIFDVSWNPSHDVQSIYRVFRFGQTKPCYVYRFVTLGTMEMKVYERQVTKQAISKRVIDEQQIDRHYNQNDLAELYRFEPSPGERPIPLVPKDVLLGELLQKCEDRIYKYHEHQTLLENKEDEVLNEEERKAAWEEFENEKKQRVNLGPYNYGRPNNIEIALMNIIRSENPTWTDIQIRAMIPSLHTQLQQQIATGDFRMYKRVQQEINVLQAYQAQRFQEHYQQQLAAAMKYQNSNMLGHLLGNQNPGTSHQPASTNNLHNTIIELND